MSLDSYYHLGGENSSKVLNMEERKMSNDIAEAEHDIVKSNTSNSLDSHSQTRNDVGLKQGMQLDLKPKTKTGYQIGSRDEHPIYYSNHKTGYNVGSRGETRRHSYSTGYNVGMSTETQRNYSDHPTGYIVGGQNDAQKYFSQTKTGYNVGSYEENYSPKNFFKSLKKHMHSHHHTHKSVTVLHQKSDDDTK
ncbi:unnamed protein product [Meganyctiphanes norvegica]|uniref:Uncharacterized protein n=1 Tax=Meganyctiphanes norvegica TaxID=48144 RepID=A0AAV2QFW5_MEGNR